MWSRSLALRVVLLNRVAAVLRNRFKGEPLPMVEHQIRFDDGAGYEQMMGIWSRFAGEIFLDWLAPPLGLRWIDIGCGNGAFTELLVERCAPWRSKGLIHPKGSSPLHAHDLRRAWQSFTRAMPWHFPFADSSFDAAVMALVLVFVPDPAKGVSEMVRVVGPGGAVVTYMWDMLGGGFPLDPILLRDARNGPCATAPTTDGCVSNGSAARLVDRLQALRTWRPGRSQCTGRLQISTISG